MCSLHIPSVGHRPVKYIGVRHYILGVLMSRTIDEAKRIIQETIDMANISEKHLNVKIVDKLPGTLACYSEPEWLITFSRWHITRAKEEDLIETVLHELAHAYMESPERYLRTVKLLKKMEEDTMMRKWIGDVDWGSHKSTRFKHALRLVKEMYEEVKSIPDDADYSYFNRQ